MNSCWKIERAFLWTSLSLPKWRHRILRDNEPPKKSDFSVAIKELWWEKQLWAFATPIILLVSRNEASLGKCFLCLKLRDTRFSGVGSPKWVLWLMHNFQNESQLKHNYHLLVLVWHFAIDFGGCTAYSRSFFHSIILLSCNISILHALPMFKLEEKTHVHFNTLLVMNTRSRVRLPGLKSQLRFIIFMTWKKISFLRLFIPQLLKWGIFNQSSD